MRVVILGAGAMGSLFAIHCAGTPDVEVVLMDSSKSTVDAINTLGVTVVADGERRTAAIAAVGELAPNQVADAVIVAVKGYDTDAAIRTIAPSIRPETVVASLQNGWGTADIIARHVPSSQMVVGVCYHSVTLVRPGLIHHTGRGPLYLGPSIGADTTRAERVASLFSGGEIAPVVMPRVHTEIWKKLVQNSATLPLGAITRLTAQAIAEDERLLALLDSIVDETIDVGLTAGFEIDRNDRLEAIHTSMRNAGDAKASMLQDVEAGRPTEVDFINGGVMAVAAERDIGAPLNAAMHALVAGYERSAGARQTSEFETCGVSPSPRKPPREDER